MAPVDGRFASGDRAVVNGAANVSALRASVPSAGATEPCNVCGKPVPEEEWVVHWTSCRDCFYRQMEEAK